MSATDEYEEWWTVSRPTPIFSIDEPIGDAGPLPNEGEDIEDRAEETQYMAIDIFTNIIDEEYDEDADPNYDGQDGGRRMGTRRTRRRSHL